MSTANSSIPKHSVLFSILVFQTVFLAFYPFFSFHAFLSPLLCLGILLLALGVSVGGGFPAAGNSWILIYAGLWSVGLFRSDFTVFQESQGILFFTQLAFFCVCAALLQSSSRQRLFLSVFLSALTVVALYGLWQAFGGFRQFADFYSAHPEEIPQNLKNDSILLQTFVSKMNNPRIYSVFTNPNMLGSFLLCAAPAFFLSVRTFFTEKQANKENALLLLLLLIPLVALVLTASRSAELLMLFCPLWMFFTNTSRRKFWSLSFLVSITLVSVFYLQPWQEALPRSFQSRLNYWETAWHVLLDFPALGSGLGSFRFEFLRHLQPGFEVTRFAHNHWLQLASEVGIPAGLLLVGWVLRILSASPKNVPHGEPSSEQTSLRCLLYPSLLLAAVLVFFPPFTILPLECSSWFSVGAVLLFFTLTLFFFRLLQKSAFSFPEFSSAAAVLLFLHSLVEFNLDTLALSVFFFGFLGVGAASLSSPLHPPSPPLMRRDFPLRILFQGFLLLGVFFTVSHIFGNLALRRSEILSQQGKINEAVRFLEKMEHWLPFNEDIQFQEALLRLQTAVSSRSEDIPAAVDRYWIMAERFSKDYLLWMTLARFARHHPENALLQKKGMLAVERSLLWAPANERLHFLKAQLLAQNRKKSQAAVILKQLLSDSASKNWGYIFSLNDAEKQEARQLLDSLS